MLGWFISLFLTMFFAVGAAIPGTVDGALTRELQARVGPQSVASVHVTGDPLLQLPFGRVPSVEARIEGLTLFGPRVQDVALRLEGVQLDPLKLIQRQAVLTAPAQARLAVRLDAADMQAYLAKLEAQGRFRGFKSNFAFLRGTINVLTPRLALRGGRVAIDGTLEVEETRMRLPFTVTSSLAIRDGRRIVAQDPQVSLNGRRLPAMFLAPLVGSLPPLLDLDRAQLPPGRWQLETLVVGPDRLDLVVDGVLTALPTR